MTKIEKVRRHLLRGWRLTTKQAEQKYNAKNLPAIIDTLYNRDGMKILNHPDGGYYIKKKK